MGSAQNFHKLYAWTCSEPESTEAGMPRVRKSKKGRLGIRHFEWEVDEFMRTVVAPANAGFARDVAYFLRTVLRQIDERYV